MHSVLRFCISCTFMRVKLRKLLDLPRRGLPAFGATGFACAAPALTRRISSRTVGRAPPCRCRSWATPPCKMVREKLARRLCKNLQIFSGLFLGCIKTKFCKQICVWQHFQALQDLQTFAPLQSRNNFSKTIGLKNQQLIFCENSAKFCKSLCCKFAKFCQI